MVIIYITRQDMEWNAYFNQKKRQNERLTYMYSKNPVKMNTPRESTLTAS